MISKPSSVFSSLPFSLRYSPQQSSAMSPFPAMAASFQSSPHIYSPPARRFCHSSANSSSSSSSSNGSVHQRSYRNLSMRTFSCQARPEHQVYLHSRQSQAESAPAKSVPERFAWISSSKSKETTSVAVPPPQPIPPASSSVGSPLFWIGVGVGFSALFSIVASNLKKYAMQQAMKAMMGGMNTQNSPFNTAGFPPVSPSPFSSPSPFTAPSPFVAPPSSSPTSSPGSATQPRTVDISATKVESAKVKAAPTAEPKVETTIKEEPKKYAFTDVSPEETQQKSPFEGFSNVSDTSSPKDTQSSGAQYTADASQNGAAFNSNTGAFGGTNSAGPGMSVDALEKMMEDPTVQKMVFPYLPEEMRNPDTFKWMLQNPQYRRQLEDMLNNMGGSNEWDSRMMDSLKNFDLSSPEVKQQFDQIGLTPEEVISKIMANPEVAMAFQNPRVQQAIMDCSQNPMSIAKYQNDKEVMDVFNKISELFPGVTGP